jgi:hypothetical protein
MSQENICLPRESYEALGHLEFLLHIVLCRPKLWSMLEPGKKQPSSVAKKLNN